MSGDTLEVLSAEREIRQQLCNYCRGLDRFDVDLWKSVWHPDATLDYTSVNLRGIAHEMAEVMTLGHDTWASHSHQITSSKIAVRGNRAVSETHCTAILFSMPDENGVLADSHYRNRYLDRWSRRDGRWAIDDRYIPASDFHWKQTGVESARGKQTRRDRSDPSYELFSSIQRGASDPLALVAAERDIRRQLHNYCRAVDRFDLELWKSVWHSDGTLDDPDANIQGNAVDLFEATTRKCGAYASHTHQSTNSVIWISGDLAVSETYYTNILRSHPVAPNQFVDEHARGRYLDRWSRRDGRWAIDHRHCVRDFTWKQAVQGTVGSQGRRDLDDPSYEFLSLPG